MVTDEAAGKLEVLLFTWDGGGNVPPFLALGKHLLSRGHSVRMVGTSTIAARAESSGVEFRPFVSAPSWEPRPGRALEDEYDGFVTHVLGPELGEELLHAVGATRPDVLVVDSMAGGALSAAEHLAIPTAVLVHLRARFHYDLPGGSERSRSARETLNRQRVLLGLASLPIEENWWRHLWPAAGRVFIASLPELEGPGDQLPPSFTYVGGLFDPEPPPFPPAVAEVAARGGRPLVVVSLSTTYMHQEHQLAVASEALDGLRGVITTGSGVDLDRSDLSRDVVAAPWVPHERLLPLADVVVTHAGHGTVVAALSAGVPLVCLPMGRDQDDNAKQVARLGAGLAIDPTADARQLRAAIDEVLGEPRYRDSARALAAEAHRLGGGERLAREIEAVASERPARAAGRSH